MAEAKEWILKGEAHNAAKRLLADMQDAKGLMADARERHKEELAELEQEAHHRCEKRLRDVGFALELKDVDFKAGKWTIDTHRKLSRLVLKFEPPAGGHEEH